MKKVDLDAIILSADEKAREAESVSRDLERKLNLKAKPKKEEVIELRMAQDKAVGCRNLALAKKDTANFKQKYYIRFLYKNNIMFYISSLLMT